MVSVYFAGHDSFGNRGCEALIRSNVKTLSAVLPDVSFRVPSNDPSRDAGQWPEASALGVSFVPSEPIPSALRWWSRARRVLPFVSRWRPALSVTPETRRQIEHSDVLVMTGGDIISLDYGLESLYFWMSVCEVAMDARIPTVLWGASVGPFSSMPAVERRMVAFLRRFDLITVRETSSLEYLRGLGVPASLVTDSAFCLSPHAPRRTLDLPVLVGEGRLVGFNVSPVIEKFRDSAEAKRQLFDEVVEFLHDVVRGGDRVLLVPHVDPFNGEAGAYNSDSRYMARILEALRQRGVDPAQAGLLPDDLNAAELKHVISTCSQFMGGRTHATVAAISMSVPTTSIAYSVKAKGINQDLFGHLDFVLETPAVNRETLHLHRQRLIDRAAQVQEQLARALPSWRERAGESAKLTAALLPR